MKKMKAVVLQQFGEPSKAFAMKEVDMPVISAGEILIKVETFGLNFADVMARQGLYQDCPKLPTILGYEVVGRIVEVAQDVTSLQVGDRVVSLTRFGGYAQFAKSDYRAAVKISEEMSSAEATCIATQYATAYFCSCYTTSLQPNEKVLIQAAAGGVGSALVQIAKHRGCEVYGTAGSDEKLAYLRSIGVDHPINYRKEDFYTHLVNEGLKGKIDVVFDSLGGKDVKKARKLLSIGSGRIICFGAASRSGKSRNPLNDVKLALGFGIVPLVTMLLNSQGFTGVNMLRIADHQPEVLSYCMKQVEGLIQSGILTPKVHKEFSVDQINQGHESLQDRSSIGKIAIHWS